MMVPGVLVIFSSSEEIQEVVNIFHVQLVRLGKFVWLEQGHVLFGDLLHENRVVTFSCHGSMCRTNGSTKSVYRQVALSTTPLPAGN